MERFFFSNKYLAGADPTFLTSHLTYINGDIMNKEIILNFIKTNSNYLYSNYNISKIGLIGSFARNEQNENSDIDFLIEFKSGTQDIFNLKLDLKKYLKTNLNREIDICREKYLKPYIKNYILDEVIYA